MATPISDAELQIAIANLQGFAPAAAALTLLEQQNGDVDASLTALLAAAAGTADYGLDRAKLKTVFIRTLRQELCGDESFRTKLEAYHKEPTKAALLTGLIVYVVELATLPINPAIATVVVLWILKVGMRVFCDYTEPEEKVKLILPNKPK